ncbi:hypothetical protein [Nocardia sp. NPDC019395]|uniref:hypothetical protein n=1 Tax=Nocardia sp. NPDC019395 TaxID=3154686 RepID=UPI0033C2B13A
MDTSNDPPVCEAAEPAPETTEEEPGPARQYSTGKLTAAQARVVSAWRHQLRVRDPRWGTRDQLPRASSSDCLAAAVIDLLDRAEPGPLQLIRYADQLRRTLAGARGREAPAVSAASFYLPGEYADQLDALLTGAQEHHAELLDEAREQVLAELPDGPRTAQVMAMISAVAERGVPFRVYRLPAGVVARRAIDRWARRSPASVVAVAVGYASESHQQFHKARKDMGIADRL